MLIGPPEARDPALDATAAATLRSALNHRSRLIPYLYTLCFTAFFDCEPIVRPLFLADPTDTSLRGVDSMFLIGQDLLVVPPPANGQPPAVPLKGKWRRVDLGDPDPALPVLYLRPGAILPTGPIIQPDGEASLDPLTLFINPDDQGSARGALYEDSGEGNAFTHNQCRRIVYAAATQNSALFVRLATLDGGLGLPRRRVDVRILTDNLEITGSGSERGTIKIDLPAPPQNP
jgi:alpha-glucosidase